MSSDSTCKNCKTQTQGLYCHNCGQRSGVHKVSFKETFGDLASGLFTVEAPIWRTTVALLVKPGELFSNYLQGQRKKYYRPVAYFILWTAIFLLVRTLLKFDPFQNVAADTSLKTDIKWLLDAGKFMSANINNFMFLFVFTLGLFLKLFYYKRYSLAEFTAISFYILCVYALINTLFQVYLKLSGNDPSFIPALLFCVYLIFAVTSFLNGNLALGILKSILIFFFSFIVYLALSFAISIAVVLLF